MTKPKPKRSWMQQHVNDFYVREAQRQGYRSRAAYKLLEIDAQDKLLKPGLTVVDLGAAPGSWCQVAREKLGSSGTIFAIDVLTMELLPGIHFIQGDFQETDTLARLTEKLAGREVDLVLSDMAPNISGVASVDQAKSIALAELARDFAGQWLKPGGSFLVKVFQGEGIEAYQKSLKGLFKTVTVRKPKASRDRSREIYLLAKACVAH